MRVLVVGHGRRKQAELRTSLGRQLPVEEWELRLEQVQRAGLDDFAVAIEAHLVGAWLLPEPDEDARSRTFCELGGTIVVEDVGAAEHRAKPRCVRLTSCEELEGGGPAFRGRDEVGDDAAVLCCKVPPRDRRVAVVHGRTRGCHDGVVGALHCRVEARRSSGAVRLANVRATQQCREGAFRADEFRRAIRDDKARHAVDAAYAMRVSEEFLEGTSDGL